MARDHGVLLIDKPAGISSAKALAPVKALAGRKTKVGHAGTLDPFATGLLLALVGDATRLSGLAMSLPKTYLATVRFGMATDTLDPEGRVLEQRDPGAAAPPALAAAVQAFRGGHEQLPPAFSALKVGGRRAYKLARAGVEAPLEPRRVVVHDVALRDVRWPDADVELVCGAGFYVRAFARDLGLAVDLPAHLVALRRERIGPYAAGDGCAPADASLDRRLLDAGGLVDAAGLDVVLLEWAQARAFAEGRVVRAPCGPSERPLCVRTDDLLVGLGYAHTSGELHPKTVFSAARRTLEQSG